MIRRQNPFRLVALVVLVALVTVSHRAAADWELAWEHWYTLEIGGAPAGSVCERAERDGELWRTSRESRFRIARGTIELEVAMSSAFIERDTGEPVELRFVSDMASQLVDTTWAFDAEARVVRSTATQGQRTLEKELAWPEGEWLTPMAARRFWLERSAAGADTIRFSTVDGENGLAPIEVTFERLGAERAERDGREIPITVWSMTSSVMPGVRATTRFTEDGFIFHDEIDLPFGRLVTRLSSEASALADLAGPAPELMIETFVQIDRPIPDARSARQLAMTLRAKSGDLPDLPSAGAQRFERTTPSSARIVVDTQHPLPASTEEIEDPAYLEASSMVDVGDAVLQKLGARAARGVEGGAGERAEAIRRFVHQYISAKVLDTGFATASEVARLRTGDCSEHGVLLCALLRTQDIPARVATGLVYADSFAGKRDIFGWHMWTQALVDGAWVDLDATLPGPYDAAHVLTATSALDDGSSDLNALIVLLGNLELELDAVGDGAPLE